MGGGRRWEGAGGHIGQTGPVLVLVELMTQQDLPSRLQCSEPCHGLQVGNPGALRLATSCTAIGWFQYVRVVVCGLW